MSIDTKAKTLPGKILKFSFSGHLKRDCTICTILLINILFYGLYLMISAVVVEKLFIFYFFLNADKRFSRVVLEMKLEIVCIFIKEQICESYLADSMMYSRRWR